MSFLKYRAILIDEAHIESADVLTVKRWFKLNAERYNLLVIAMSATHPGETALTSNYPIEDFRVDTLDDASKMICPRKHNVLFYTPSINNPKMESMLTRRGFEVIKYNSKTIADNPNLPSMISEKTEKQKKGIAIMATRVADVGFNAYVHVVYTSDEDYAQIVDHDNDRLISTLTKRKITIPTYIQRRGRVGRRLPGTCIYQGIHATNYYDPKLLDHFYSDLRCTILGMDTLVAETLIFINSLIGQSWLEYSTQIWDWTWDCEINKIDEDNTLKRICTYNPFKAKLKRPEDNWDGNSDTWKTNSLASPICWILFRILPTMLIQIMMSIKRVNQDLPNPKKENVFIEGGVTETDDEAEELIFRHYKYKYMFKCQTDEAIISKYFYKDKPNAPYFEPVTKFVCNHRFRLPYLYEEEEYYIFLRDSPG